MALTDLPQGSTQPDDTELLDVLAHIPGGRHIVAHVNDGPWYLKTVTSAEEPHWTADAAMAAYPGVALPWLGYGVVYPTVVFAMPAFASELMSWNSTEGEMTVDDEACSGPFENPPGPDEWAEHMAAACSNESEVAPGVTQAFATAIRRSSVTAVATFLSGLADVTLTDPAAVAAAVDGTFSPAAQPAR